MKKPSKFVFFLLFVAAILLYFYRYPKMLAFDADQEFYANQYLQIVKEHKLTLLGIETSTGGLYVGPLYTYLNAFFYWLFKGDPQGIFLFTLIFSSFQASLTYYFFTKLKGKYMGMIGGLIVLFSAALWNKAFISSPVNFLYLSGLFFFYTLAKLAKNHKYFLWLGVILALTLQIHLSLFFFFPITLVFLLWLKLINRKNAGHLLRVILLVIISLSPLLSFDLRHNFLISTNLLKFISPNTFGQKGASVFSNITDVFWSFVGLFSYILTPKPGIFVYLFLAAVFIFFLIKMRKEFIYKTIGLVFAVSSILFVLYRGPEPDYFFYFLLPPFFFVTAEFIILLGSYKSVKYPVYILLIILLWQNLQFMNSTLNNYSFYLKRRVARYIKSQSQGKKVKISYDTDLGFGFGFDYLLRYEGVKIDNDNYEEHYHIVVRNYPDYPGVEFKEAGSHLSIKVKLLSQ